MNSQYLLAVVAVVILVFFIIGYYLYQEAKFRKMVEDSFNQRTDDILLEKSKSVVFAGEQKNENAPIEVVEEKIIKKDQEIELDNLPNVLEENSNKPENDLKLFDEIQEGIEEIIPEDSVEALFKKYDQIEFPYKNLINSELDLVIDVVFEDTIKIKNLYDMTQFTPKKWQYFVLDKNHTWTQFESGKKYVISGLRLVVELIDSEGVINQAQITNIYGILHKFALDNQGHIRHSNYADSIEKIKNQIVNIEDLALELSLYMAIKNAMDYKALHGIFANLGLREHNGTFALFINDKEVFSLHDAEGRNFSPDKNYEMFTIVAKMHLQADPNVTIERILDFSEQFMNIVESRLLTANKMVFSEREYKILTDYVNKYVESAQKHNVQLGSNLLLRIYHNIS